MSKILSVTTLLLEQDLKDLKKKTKVYTAKDAVAKAVEHYLKCDNT